MSGGRATAGQWYEVAAAAADLTPPAGFPLAGNFRDDYASRGVHGPLSSRALVVRQGDAAVAMIAADLLSTPERLVRRVRQEVRRLCGLDAEQVLVSATHTYSGPAVEAVAGPDCADEAIERAAAGMVESCVRAFRSCRPMRLWRAAARADGVFFNRRLRLRDGSTAMNWTRPPLDTIDRPLGPVDPEIGVLLAGRERRLPAVVAVNAALHAAVLAGDNWLISPDWPGYCAGAIGQVLGRDVSAMFFQGAEGNVNHIDARDPLQGRGFKEAQRIGAAIGLAAAGSRFAARPISGPLAWSSEVVALPPRRISEEQLAQARATLDRETRSGKPQGQVDGIPEAVFAADQIEMARRTLPYRAEIQTLRVGDLAIVGLPGEFFVEFGLAIKAASPARATWVVGLANGSLGYVPTVEAFAEGGYEPTAWRYGKLAPEAGDICVASAVRQLGELGV